MTDYPQRKGGYLVRPPAQAKGQARKLPRAQVFNEAAAGIAVSDGTKIVEAHGLKLDLFELTWREVVASIERNVSHAAGQVVHGSSMAGEFSGFTDSADLVTVVAVGGESGGDGRNCDGCLEMHGTEMTGSEFLDWLFTEQCNGNCRCRAVPSSEFDGAGAHEPVRMDEVSAAMEEVYAAE